MLRIYDAVRRPDAQEHVRGAQAALVRFTFRDEGTEELPARPDSVAKLERWARVIVEGWEWCWTSTMDADVQRALEMLEKGD